MARAEAGTENQGEKRMDGLRELLSSKTFWMIFGFTGQALFGGAFLIQWIVSERRKRSHIPLSFWYLRIAGSLMLLGLTIHMWQKSDEAVVLIAGYSVNCIVYVRNLMLINKHGDGTATTTAGTAK